MLIWLLANNLNDLGPPESQASDKFAALSVDDDVEAVERLRNQFGGFQLVVGNPQNAWFIS